MFKHPMQIFLNERFSSWHKMLDLQMRIHYNTYTSNANSKCKFVKPSFMHNNNNQNVSICDVVPVTEEQLVTKRGNALLPLQIY